VAVAAFFAVGAPARGDAGKVVGVSPDNACAVRDGHVNCWGASDCRTRRARGTPKGVYDYRCSVSRVGSLPNLGQLGSREHGRRVTVVRVRRLSNAVAVTAGMEHTCALTAAGTVKCWGRGVHGELGDGRRANSVRPVQVQGIANVRDVSAGGGFTCAVQGTGSVWCWGRDDLGELGDGGTRRSAVPVQVSGIDDAVEVSAAASYACAVRSDGSVACWGGAWYGELGDGRSGKNVHRAPIAVPNVTGARRVATEISVEGHACAVTTSGAVECWGANGQWQLGLSDGDGGAHLATTVPGVDHVTDVAVAEGATCAVRESGRVVCWGNLSDRFIAPRPSFKPVTLPRISDAVSIAGSTYNFCIARASGKLACIGRPDAGALGHQARCRPSGRRAIGGLLCSGVGDGARPARSSSG
jgi:alpha-tubulin suppressor-like RCC1 family protein